MRHNVPATFQLPDTIECSLCYPNTTERSSGRASALITAFAIDPTGLCMATTSTDNEIALWDTLTRCIRKFICLTELIQIYNNRLNNIFSESTLAKPNIEAIVNASGAFPIAIRFSHNSEFLYIVNDHFHSFRLNISSFELDFCTTIENVIQTFAPETNDTVTKTTFRLKSLSCSPVDANIFIINFVDAEYAPLVVQLSSSTSISSNSAAFPLPGCFADQSGFVGLNSLFTSFSVISPQSSIENERYLYLEFVNLPTPHSCYLGTTSKGFINLLCAHNDQLNSHPVSSLYLHLPSSAHPFSSISLSANQQYAAVFVHERMIKIITISSEAETTYLQPQLKYSLQLRSEFSVAVDEGWQYAFLTSTGDYLVIVGHVASAPASATGSRLSTSTDTPPQFQCWHIPSSTLVKSISTVGDKIITFLFHPCERLFFTLSESGRVHIWKKKENPNWVAFAPDFVELEDNEEYIEKESEFDAVLVAPPAHVPTDPILGTSEDAMKETIVLDIGSSPNLPIPTSTPFQYLSMRIAPDEETVRNYMERRRKRQHDNSPHPEMSPLGESHPKVPKASPVEQRSPSPQMPASSPVLSSSVSASVSSPSEVLSISST